MPTFENGIKRYVKAKATIEVSFPVDWHDKEFVNCKQCPYLSSNERMCQLNKQPVAFPNQYLGGYCPLTFEE